MIPGSDVTSPEHSQAHSHSTPSGGGNASTPHSNLASPEPQYAPQPQAQPQKQNMDKRRSSTVEEPEQTEEEVEALSDMMCSLVTNNCGETRYIGMLIGLPMCL